METPERDFDLTEIINGEEIMGPSPFSRHQMLVFRIADEGNKYKKHSFAAVEGVVTSEAIEGLQVNITDVFDS
ncbi:MAG: hypothetical protein HQL01_13740 [Nitrospirae bacterium]|nr:hypothetical protein [Nitrospirota bacterium]